MLDLTIIWNLPRYYGGPNVPGNASNGYEFLGFIPSNECCDLVLSSRVDWRLAPLGPTGPMAAGLLALRKAFITWAPVNGTTC